MPENCEVKSEFYRYCKDSDECAIRRFSRKGLAFGQPADKTKLERVLTLLEMFDQNSECIELNQLRLDYNHLRLQLEDKLQSKQE